MIVNVRMTYGVEIDPTGLLTTAQVYLNSRLVSPEALT